MASSNDSAATTTDGEEEPGPLTDAPGLVHGARLAHFFSALTELQGGANRKVRVSHYGDSSVGLDHLPGNLRRRFQARFGNGGPGFVLLQPHTGSYRHRQIRPDGLQPWDICYLPFRCHRDGRYGLGGVAFGGRGSTRFERRNRFDTLEVWYDTRPNGGRVEVLVDEAEPLVIDASSESPSSAWHSIDSSSASAITVRGRGRVRVFGVVLERNRRGVVWDTHSMEGTFTSRVLEWDEANIREQVAHRQPDLIIFGFGGNDLRRLQRGRVTPERFESETRRAITRLRAGRPEASCLVFGINDHGNSRQAAVAEQVEAIIEAQRRAAIAERCAFYDTYAVMGGRGSIRRWLRLGLAGRDLTHLNRRGREILAERIFEELTQAHASTAIR